MKSYTELIKTREEAHFPKLVDIGKCSLHVIHCAFKTGIESTNWEVKKKLKVNFQLLHDLPVRRTNHLSVTSLDIFPLCATRWVEDKKAADRLLELWENLTKIMNFWQSLPKSKRPSCKSYEHLKAATNNVLTPLKLSFFIFYFCIIV